MHVIDGVAMDMNDDEFLDLVKKINPEVITNGRIRISH